jgi:UDP-N-acetyl-D-mannosaminuronic acid dehydrogenase
MCKLVENSSRDVQIAFANELSIICDKASLNVRDLIKLANKHPRVNILQPACGVGGHCIAVDPYFIVSAFPNESKIISKAREINNFKPEWCIEKIKNVSLEFELRNKAKPTIAILGLSFKPNIEDLRESPALYIAKEIYKNNAECLIVEPNISSHNFFEISKLKEAKELSDIIVVLVLHDEFKDLKISDDKILLDFCGIT